MKIPYFLCILLMFLFYGVSFSQSESPAGLITGKTPGGFEAEINAFLRQDSASFPPEGACLFTGSSTIRKWDGLPTDFHEITLIQRGFGGSTMAALNYYLNYIVLPYKPSTIVVYEGDNDLVSGIDPKKFVAQCDTFIGKVHRVLPKTTIYFMSIKPSFARKQLLSLQHETNRQLKGLLKKRRKTKYIDITRLMYDKGGKLRKDYFESESLHVNAACYKVWAGYMKTKMGLVK